VVTGPLFGGVVVETLGRAPSFLIAATLVALVAAYAYANTAEPRRPPPLAPLATTALAVRSEPLVVGGLAVVAVLGLVFGALSVLVPLGLARNGLSEGEVGYVFSATAAVFILVSGIVARRAASIVTLDVATLIVVAHAAALAIPLASVSTVALVALLVIRAPFWAAGSTIAYPLTANGAHRAGIGRGATFGLLNVCWGAAAVAGPVMSATIAEAFGERSAYGALAALCLVAVVLLRSLAQRERSN
jgi:hypothetical protein